MFVLTPSPINQFQIQPLQDHPEDQDQQNNIKYFIPLFNKSINSKSVFSRFSDKVKRELKYLNIDVVTEIKEYYDEYFPEDVKDFNSLRSDDEYEILKKCVQLIPHGRNNKVSRFAVISFYYLVVVLEYYVHIKPKNIIHKSEIAQFRLGSDERLEEYNRIFIEITCSDEKWASKMRRLVYKFD